mmetsp:Transcript_44505/g.128674  ORF Transcript_44505/g.128674 Transcript_44505/m.128674 type:complete len:221 (+) Transcript_44505:723-1385(+)
MAQFNTSTASRRAFYDEGNHRSFSKTVHQFSFSVQKEGVGQFLRLEEHDTKRRCKDTSVIVFSTRRKFPAVLLFFLVLGCGLQLLLELLFGRSIKAKIAPQIATTGWRRRLLVVLLLRRLSWDHSLRLRSRRSRWWRGRSLVEYGEGVDSSRWWRLLLLRWWRHAVRVALSLRNHQCALFSWGLSTKRISVSTRLALGRRSPVRILLLRRRGTIPSKRII